MKCNLISYSGLCRNMLLLSAAIICFFSFASCGKLTPAKDRGAIYIHLSSEPGHLNPITSNDGYASTINGNIYESLLDMDYDTFEFRGQLAEKWTISKDRLCYRFYLKKGVRWSDGAEFTADDVVYSFDRIKDPKVACAPLKVYYIDVLKAVRINKYAVEFIYSRPYFRGLEVCGTIPVIPKHIFSKGADFNNHPAGRMPVGTGPYRLEKWDTGKSIVLTANKFYYGHVPEIKKIIYKIILEPSVALQMLKKGDLDVMNLRPIQWMRQTGSSKFNSNYYKLQYYTPHYSYIGWNARNDLFKDSKVRLAMTHMIDRESILKNLHYGLGRVVTGTFYIFSKSTDPSMKPWPYDPARARELLKEAGWADHDGDGFLDKNGKKFSFVYTIPSASKFGERLGTMMKEDLSKAGIEMTIERYEWAVFVKKLDARDFQAVMLSWSLGYSDDPYQLWHSSQIDKGSNFCGFRNAEADRLIEKARVEFDENKRNLLYQRFDNIIHREQPYTFLFCLSNLAVVNRRITNVIVHKRGLNIHEWKLKKDI